MILDCAVRHPFSESFSLDLGFVIDFAKEGPIAALFGPTGSGKSATLAAIAGVFRPERGRILFGDEVFYDWGGSISRQPSIRRVGWVPQDALLFPHMTVEANLNFGEPRAKGKGGPALDEVARVLDLAPLLGRGTRALSGGERQRVALGRALLSAPRLLLLDEPVSALDEASRFRALGFVERVVGEFGVPALFVSHQRTEVMRLANRVVRLEGGKSVEEGSAADVLGHAPGTGSVDSLLRLEPGPAGPTLSGRPVSVAGGATVAAPAWARLPSSAVLLARHAPTDLSARNAMPGRVLTVAEAGGVVRVAVDAGQAIAADLTPAAVRDLGLAPGAEVFCVFKAQALEVIG
ncbi:MAG TPA: TOBE-like domain-containing protein [Planctomycetota bacterium]|nr:TOBE-like domain-containing protein [Planctomycetota bacterium]